MIYKKITVIIITFILFLTLFVSAFAFSVVQLNSRLISDSVILIDGDTGQILYEKNMHKQMRPASLVKIMTVLLALELGDPDDIVTMTRSALNPIEPTAAIVPLFLNEEFSLADAMYAIAIVSAADASNAVAEHIGGTLNNFVGLMNARAKELGAFNTNFTNSHGMPDNNQYTTAYDLALIAKEAVGNNIFNGIFSTAEYEFLPTNKRNNSKIFKNLNRMITGAFIYDGLIAGKTGWTRSSQHTLFTAARRDGRTLICISLKTPSIDDKYIDTTRLFDFGFNEFENIEFSATELGHGTIHNFTDENGIEREIELIVNDAFTALLPKTLTKNNVEITYDFSSSEIENEINAVIGLSIDEASGWLGYHIIGEVSTVARYTLPVLSVQTDDEPDINDPALLDDGTTHPAPDDINSFDMAQPDTGEGDLSSDGLSNDNTPPTENEPDESSNHGFIFIIVGIIILIIIAVIFIKLHKNRC